MRFLKIVGQVVVVLLVLVGMIGLSIGIFYIASLMPFIWLKFSVGISLAILFFSALIYFCD